jgi:hypothetical protein
MLSRISRRAPTAEPAGERLVGEHRKRPSTGQAKDEGQGAPTDATSAPTEQPVNGAPKPTGRPQSSIRSERSRDESSAPPNPTRSLEGEPQRLDSRGEIDRRGSDPRAMRAPVTTEVAVGAERDDLVLIKRGEQTRIAARPFLDEFDRGRKYATHLDTLSTVEAHIEAASQLDSSRVLTEVGGRVRAAHLTTTLGGR